jgi:ABC-type phosphate/phosphonate transport system substrate-binding protein
MEIHHSLTSAATPSRRTAIGLILGACGISRLRAEAPTPIRLALSESLVSGVNINDARAAMQIWVNQMAKDLNVALEMSPKVFDTADEISRRARAGLFDAVAVTIVEYRKFAEFVDPSQLLVEGGPKGEVQYLLLARKSSGATRLSDLRNRRLIMLENTRMCVASAWLAGLLAEAHLNPSDQFFASVTSDIKASRVVLPVFFGQADACLTSKFVFDTMCELNPQVGRELTVVASSPPLVATFFAFHRNYHGEGREKLRKIYLTAPRTAAERQLATLFEFRQLMPHDASFLAPTLAILDAAERLHPDPAGGRK